MKIDSVHNLVDFHSVRYIIWRFQFLQVFLSTVCFSRMLLKTSSFDDCNSQECFSPS